MKNEKGAETMAEEKKYWHKYLGGVNTKEGWMKRYTKESLEKSGMTREQAFELDETCGVLVEVEKEKPQTSFLTMDEERELRGMDRYWQEVMRREDQSPLIYEARQVYRMLGARVLNIISAYFKLLPLIATCKELITALEGVDPKNPNSATLKKARKLIQDLEEK